MLDKMFEWFQTFIQHEKDVWWMFDGLRACWTVCAHVGQRYVDSKQVFPLVSLSSSESTNSEITINLANCFAAIVI